MISKQLQQKLYHVPKIQQVPCERFKPVWPYFMTFFLVIDDHFSYIILTKKYIGELLKSAHYNSRVLASTPNNCLEKYQKLTSAGNGKPPKLNFTIAPFVDFIQNVVQTCRVPRQTHVKGHHVFSKINRLTKNIFDRAKFYRVKVKFLAPKFC